MFRIYGCHQAFTSSEADHQCGRRLLATGLNSLAGIQLTAADLATTPSGKPYLRTNPAFHFNISHCRGLVVCAIADAPVGIDVEGAKEWPLAILQRTLSTSERAQLTPLQSDPTRFWLSFTRLWSLKEAYLKWQGSGLAVDPWEVSFDITSSCYGPIPAPALQPHLAQVLLNDHTVLTICADQRLPPTPTVHWFQPSNLQRVMT